MTAATKRRPGFPRKLPDPGALDRITLRMETELYDDFTGYCGRTGLTQREFVEAAIREELKRPPKPERPINQPQKAISRTGMWIDPDLLAEMDRRIEAEGSSQRAFVEDAVRRRMNRRRRRPKER